MSIKDTMQNVAINQALKYIEGNPDENIPKLMALANKVLPEGWYGEQRKGLYANGVHTLLSNGGWHR